MFFRYKKLVLKFGTFYHVSILFLLLNIVQEAAFAVEFFPFNSSSSVNDVSLSTTAIEFDEDVIWIGSLNGLIMLRPGETKVFDVFSGHTQTNHVSDIVVSSDGVLWAAFVGGGVFAIDQGTNRHFLLQDKYELDDLNCFDIELDERQQFLFLACETSLYSLNLKDETFRLLDVVDENGQKVEEFFSLSSINSEKLLVGTWGQGLYEVNLKTLNAERISINANYFHRTDVIAAETVMLSTDNGVYIYYSDEQRAKKILFQENKDIWDYEVVSTRKIGEERYLVAFSVHGLFELNTSTGVLKSVDIYTPFLEKQHIGYVDNVNVNKDGLSIGVGADGRGFFVLPLKHHFTKYFISSALARMDVSMVSFIDGNLFMGDWENLVKFESFNSKVFAADIGVVVFVVSTKNGYLVGTLENGLIRLDKPGSVIGRVDSIPGLPSDTSPRLDEILELGGGDFLLLAKSTENYGLYRGNFIDGFSQVHDSFPGRNMVKVSESKVLISSFYEGILLYDLEQATFKKFVPEVDGLQIDCVEKINEEEYFVCLRRNQSVIFNSATESFSEFLSEYPILRNVRDVKVDKNGLWWISSSHGLYTYDTLAERIVQITKNEGVISNDFSPDSMLLHENRLIVPGDKGIVEIDVDKARDFLEFKKSQQTQSFITQADYIVDEQTEVQQASGEAIEQGLSLPHSNIILKLKFSHNNFLELEDLAFDVRMVGLNDDWNTLEVGEYTTTYTTLPPGDYEFQVRVNDPRSLAPQPVQSLKLSILPPWWLTTPAFVSYLALLALSFYLFSWYRNKRLIILNKQLTEKVSERTATITKLLKQKQTFFANVSHEFRTPLSLIMGPLDSIAEVVKAPEQQNNLNIMRRNTSRLMKLVDQILDLAKFETSQSLPKQVYEVKSSLEILAASFAPLLEHKQQSLQLKDISEIRLKLVEDSFEIIMTNLLSNAIKYCPNGSKIVVSMSVVGKNVELDVADNGPGISEENQALLFERFTRFDVAENIQGSGIGLALVKQLVTNNGGVIRVESQPGAGTCFHISFPINVAGNAEVTRTPLIQVLDSDFMEEQPEVSESLQKENSKANVIEGTTPQKNARLLIVEDNADLRTFLSDSLDDEYELDIAVNGEQGLKKAQDAIPDLILSDVLMPVMDGYELSNAIRSDEVTSHIPIILITAKGDDLSRMKGWEEQVDDYISKPFKMNELQIRIKRLLSIRDILRNKHTSELANNLATKNKEAISFQTKKDAEFFKAFEKVIEEHYSEETFSRSDAAGHLFIEARQLNRKLAALMDYNFSEYLRKYRLQKSTELLLAGKQVTEVAYDVGFNSPSYFSSCFKAEFDETPSKYVECRESAQSQD